MASFYCNLSADTLVKTGPGKLNGIFVASGTPTIKIWDQTSAAAPIMVNTFTAAAATFYPFPEVQFTRGLFIDISTGDLTIFYE